MVKARRMARPQRRAAKIRRRVGTGFLLRVVGI
jgi:hypothetical protein